MKVWFLLSGTRLKLSCHHELNENGVTLPESAVAAQPPRPGKCFISNTYYLVPLAIISIRLNDSERPKDAASE